MSHDEVLSFMDVYDVNAADCILICDGGFSLFFGFFDKYENGLLTIRDSKNVRFDSFYRNFHDGDISYIRLINLDVKDVLQE